MPPFTTHAASGIADHQRPSYKALACFIQEDKRGYTSNGVLYHNPQWSKFDYYMRLVSAAENIIAKIQEAGFAVSLNKETHLTKEMAEQLYSDHRSSEFFDQLTDMMSR